MQIDDAATQALMVEFYRNLFERKLGKLESLRQAQLWLLNHPNVIKGRNLAHHPLYSTESTAATSPTLNHSSRSLPVFWAAFSLAGDPR